MSNEVGNRVPEAKVVRENITDGFVVPLDQKIDIARFGVELGTGLIAGVRQAGVRLVVRIGHAFRFYPSSGGGTTVCRRIHPRLGDGRARSVPGSETGGLDPFPAGVTWLTRR